MNGTSLVESSIALPGGAAAVYQGGTNPAFYRHSDWLGSSRLASTSGGGLYDSSGYGPNGEPYDEALGGSGGVDRVFTGKEQTALEGLYDFPAREYSPMQSRWLSPDPAGLGAVDPNHPQSWNRYAYALNQPLRLTDPLGTDTGDQDDPCQNANSPCPNLGTIAVANARGYYHDITDYLMMYNAMQWLSWATNETIYYPTGIVQLSDAVRVGPSPRNAGSTTSGCLTGAVKRNAFAFALDAAGVGAGFLPGGDVVVAGAQMAVDVGATANSAIDGDAVGALGDRFWVPSRRDGSWGEIHGCWRKGNTLCGRGLECSWVF